MNSKPKTNNGITTDEEWSYRRGDVLSSVKRNNAGWYASIGKIVPIGAGFTKNFCSKAEAIHFVLEYMKKRFDK